jgi:hypothetical protein
MGDRENTELNPERPLPHTSGPHPRAVGSPLPRGSVRRAIPSPRETDSRHLPPPPGRMLAHAHASEPPPANDQPSNMQRAVNILRGAVPFVQNLLPLLDGKIATAVANVLTMHHPTSSAAPPVDLAPLEDCMAGLQTQQREFHDQLIEQNTSLRRVEDQLEMVREATDRNTLEQQELMEDLRAVGNKVNWFALAALALLLASVILNVVLYLHIQHVLP